MIIESIQVRNFRSILDEMLSCSDLTILVGPNGSGKSAFLRALDLFYAPSPRIEPEDFYGGDTNAEIVVAITYKVITEEAKRLFDKYMQGEIMTVERVLTLDAGKVVARTHGSHLQCPDFTHIGAAASATEKRAAYDELRKLPDYQDLPRCTSQAAVLEALADWERDNPGKCVRLRDDGQFFGYKGVGQGYLNRYSRFLFIPAVRDASEDAAEGRGSVITSLMDLVVRSVLAANEEVVKLKEETQRRYEEIVSPDRLQELSTLADHMTKTLRDFVPDAAVLLEWLPFQDVSIPMPQAGVKLVEDGYEAPVGRTGHGLQRAFILTALQHLVMAQVSAGSSNSADEVHVKAEAGLPSLILAIEEPELYQHPNRQRHFARVLAQLASGRTPGVADRTQIIYATHSPLLVGIDQIDRVRLLRKVGATEGKPRITRVVATSLAQVAQELWSIDGKPGIEYTGTTLAPRLHAVMTPWMNEGFFADVVVLVEGEDDRAAILGMARSKGIDLESDGYAVIPCGGKTSLDRPTLIFRQLGIPVYVIWDGDKGEKDPRPEQNHRLLKLMGQDPIGWPAEVHDQFTCFEKNLETTLRSEIGEELFDRLLAECQQDLCILKRKHAVKNPCVINTVIRGAQAQGWGSATLEDCLQRILALKPQTEVTRAWTPEANATSTSRP